ncbi:MAG: hypothetical protein V5A44_08615 [Haloarculaceae archaeon]
MPTRRSLLATLAATGLAGCSFDPDSGERQTGTTATGATPPGGSCYWYTHPQSSGNRLLSGGGNVRGAEAVRFEPAGRPEWLVAHPATEGSHWTVVADDGRASRWVVREESAERVAGYDPLPAGTPPVVATGDGAPRLVRPPRDMAPRTSPAVVPAGEGPAKLLYVAADGAVVVASGTRTRLAVDALRDGRPAALGDGRYVCFADPTDRYRHGALGDTTEGASLVTVDATDPAVDWTASVGPPEVFEGLQPLVADLNGDGDPEVVATVADAANGARIAVFDADGERLATGPVYGPGWRHQLAVAPFAPDDRPELAVVRKPHVDRVVEFYRLDGSLDVVATVEGVSTHTYGSRVLDGALAADFDGDGRTELLAPTSDRRTLVAVRRTRDGAEIAWRRTLDSPVGSNLAGVALADGVAVGVGVGETVTVWQG